jgi:O-antigen/teichoic acid export membrane protein
VAQFLNSLILYLRSNFEGLLLFGWDSVLSVMDRILMIIICGLLLWGPKFSILNSQFSIFTFVYAQVAAYSLTAIIALVMIGRKASLRRLRWNRRFFLVILKKSAPFALLVLLMASYNRLDPILLRALHSDTEAGIYAGAFRILDALTMVAYLVSIPLLPIFSRLTRSSAHSPQSTLPDALRIVLLPMLIFSAGAALLCSFFARTLMMLLYPTAGELYVPAFRVIIFGIIPISLTYIFGTLLTAGGHLRQLNIFAACSLVFNIIANLMLIPHLGAVGSAWASLTTQSLMAAAQTILAVRLYRLPASVVAPPSFKEIALFLKQKKE